MRITNVSIADGQAVAFLVQLLITGRWDMSGKQAESLVQTKQWVHQLATSMAEQLRATEPPPATTSGTGMRVKSMGSITPAGTAVRKSKRRG